MCYYSCMNQVNNQHIATLEQKKRFAQELIRTGNKAESVQRSMPDFAESRNRDMLSKKGWKLLQDEVVQHELMVQKQKMQVLGSKALARLEEIILTGKEHNALDASKFVFEQAQGKAKQTVDMQSTSVNLTLDLTGGAVLDGELVE